ncbi:MAG: histidinol phosphate phosphatase, partial [Candidatus Latescibacteria bacterium]|nr:histidinol phosphate phosphatase [Candidatus Latescibacterota bacterium]
DKGAETLLREMIDSRFPNDGIVGEEHADKEGTTGRRWILDPIDGTKSFVHGVPLYGVMVGVEVDDEPAVGVVNFPALNEMLSGAKGLGAWWNGRRARVSGVSEMKDATVIMTSYMNRYGKDEAVERLCGAAKLVRGWGDCYGYAMVATGRAEVQLDPKMNVWDCAALAPIMEEAGGTFTTWDGTPTIWGDEAVGTNGVLFDDVMAMIRG